MSDHLKKLLSLLLALVMLLSMLPTVSFAAASRDDGGKNDKKKNSDEIWDTICRIEDEKIIATRGKNATARDYAAIVNDVIAAVEASDSYVEGSLERHGNFFFWVTEDGEPQGYSPSLRSRVRATAKENVTAEDLEGKTETVSFASKGGSPSATNIAVFQPYYGLDSSFTTQYKEEGVSVASATGGTSTTYLTTNATITNIAAAMQSCAVVFFDSHGTTDYDGASLGYTYPDDTSEYVTDYVTQANSSYLCLQSKTGIDETVDGAAVTGTYGTYYHYFNGGKSGSMYYYCVDGTAIANHMTQNAPNNFLWMAICLGMATDGLYSSLRNKGVEVVYGYSQSVSFYGDYAYEAHFWDLMKNGSTVKDAIASMKSTYGNWDPAYYRGVSGSSNNYYVPTSGTDSNYDTIGEARYYCVPFPNVVSSEDSYNGHRTTNPSSKTAANSTTYNASYGACNIQTVNSTWKLMGDPEPATVTLMAGSSSYSTLNTYTNTATTLPNYTGTVPTGYTFAGWTTAAINGTTNTKPTLYTNTFTPSETSTTLYACFSKADANGGSGDYKKVVSTRANSDFEDGTYLIVCESNNVAFNGGLDTLDAVSNTIAVTISNNTIESNATTDAATFTYSSADGSFLSASGKYIGNASNSNALSTSTSVLSNTVSLNGTDVDIVSAGGAYLRYNQTSGQTRFRYFKSSTYSSQQPIQLYKLAAGGNTYTTTITVCNHSNLTAHAANAATCGAAGNSAYWSCPDCGAYFSDAGATTSIAADSWVIPATGNHTYGSYISDGASGHHQHCSVCGNNTETVAHQFGAWNVVTAASGSNAGTKTHICSDCSFAESKNYYVVSFTVPEGLNLTPPAAQTCFLNDSITLPNADNFTDSNSVSYTFVGWVVTDCNNQTSAPASILTGEYTPSGNVTLKALYKYYTDGNGEKVYDLVTETPTSWSGNYVITYKTDSSLIALKGLSGTTSYESASCGGAVALSSTGMSLENNQLSDVNSSYVFEITSQDDKYTIRNTNVNTYLASISNYLKSTDTYADTTCKWSIAISSGATQLSNSNSTNYPYFSYGTYFNLSSSASTNIHLWRETDAGIPHWTSIFVAPCAHSNAKFHAVVPATCVDDGTTAYWYCSDCAQYFADSNGSIGAKLDSAGETIPALGHDYQIDSSASTAATCTTNGTTVYVCSHDASHTYSETVPSTGHTPSEAVEENRVEATTSAAGHYDSVVYCSVCHAELSRQTVTIPQIVVYTVTYHTPTGVQTVAAVTEVAGTVITLPAEPSGTPDGYTFLGWTTQTYAIDNTTVVSAIDNSYTVNANADLYALYTYSDGTGTGSGSGNPEDLYTWSKMAITKAGVSNDGGTKTGATMAADTDMSTSGGTYTYYASTGTRTITITGLNTTGYTDLTISFYGRTSSTGTSNGAVVSVSSDGGTTWTEKGTSSSWTSSEAQYTVNLGDGGFNAIQIVKAGGNNRFGTVAINGTPGSTGTTYYTTMVAGTHNWDEGTVTTPATCTTPGVMTYTCTDEGCGETKEVAIPALGHTVGTAYGHDSTNHWQICTVCGEPCDVAAHTPDAGVYTAATFNTAGHWTYTCTACGYSYTVENASDPATGTVKTYSLLTDLSDLKTGDKVVIYNPANTKAMTSTLVNTYYLSGADATISGTTLTSADETAVWTVTKNQDGTYTFTQDNDVALYGYVSGSYVDLAIASGEGYINKWSVSEVDSTNHKYSILCDGLTYTKNNTTYNSVYLEYYNSRFALYGNNNALTESDGAYLMQFYVLDVQPTFVGESLTVNGDILVNAVVAIPAGLTDNNTDLVVKIYDGDAATGTPIQTVSVSSADLVSQGYKFTVLKPAKEIQDNVTLLIYDGDEPISMINSEDNQTVDAMSYSVQTYLDKVIGNADTYDALYPGLSDLCKAMSDYGYYAQEQQGYKTDSLSHTAHDLYFSDEYDGVYDLIKDGYKYSRSKIGDGITAHSGSVVMLAQTAIRVYFAVTDKTADYSAAVSFKNAAYTDFTADWYSDDHDFYMVEIRNIAADDFDEGFTVTLTDGNGNSATVTNYSVYSYVRQTLKNSTGSDLALDNVVKAIYVYGQKAEAYFN